MAQEEKDNCHEQGSALVYILIAIALLAALTFTFMQPSSQQASSQNVFKTVTKMQSQADIIRSTIQACILSYKRGDRSIDVSASGTDPGARKNFPIKPNSTHFSSAAKGPTTGRLVRDLRCPGNPGNNDENHEKIFGGTTGRFMPSTPELFEPWQYYNGYDGIFFWIQTNKSDAYLNSALYKLDEQFSECEADVVDARAGATDLDSDGEVECPNGYLCFRIRMVTNASAVYNGDSDGEEAAASCP
jgi:hypothetical protein